MVSYPYPKPANFNADQLLEEIFAALNLWPQTYDHEGANVIVGFVTALTTAEETNLMQTVTNHVADPYYRQKKRVWVPEASAILWATIQSFDIPNKKITVRKVMGGTTFTKGCSVAWAIKKAYDLGEIAVGDKVLVTFVDGDLSKPIVLDKVIL